LILLLLQFGLCVCGPRQTREAKRAFFQRGQERRKPRKQREKEGESEKKKRE